MQRRQRNRKQTKVHVVSVAAAQGAGGHMDQANEQKQRRQGAMPCGALQVVGDAGLRRGQKEVVGQRAAQIVKAAHANGNDVIAIGPQV